MATNTAGAQGQEYHQNLVHYVAKEIVFGDDDLVVTVGKIPPLAVVIRVGCVVTTAFSANSVMDIGTSADPDAFGSALVMTTAGHITDLSSDPHIANDDYSATADLTIVASLTSSGAISAGRAVVYCTYLFPGVRS
jgi:hypothetical protein